MDNLLAKSNKKVTGSIEKIKRLIYDDIQWEERLILLLGYRGVGKTTLMLQRLKE
jgi:predicted AAA+ superfamily ATPase